MTEQPLEPGSPEWNEACDQAFDIPIGSGQIYRGISQAAMVKAFDSLVRAKNAKAQLSLSELTLEMMTREQLIERIKFLEFQLCLYQPAPVTNFAGPAVPVLPEPDGYAGPAVHVAEAPDGWALPGLLINACDTIYGPERIAELEEFEKRNPGTVQWEHIRK